MNRICAGIVLYNPDINRLKDNINSIIEQVDCIYMQDNGSSNIALIEELMKNYTSTILLKNGINRGIAWALNRLCERSLVDGYQWIITLDQDSVCPSNMVNEFTLFLQNADMICPKIVDRNYGLLDGGDVITEYIKECITSGCLLNLQAWKKVDGFDEAMFIDGVDFEFCYRMHRDGFKIMRVNSVVLYHEIGNITIRRFLGMKVVVKNHSVFRKYYIAKNIIYMARKRKSGLLLIKGVLQEIKLLGIVILYEEDKLKKIERICKGIIDGMVTQLNKED